MTLDSSSIDEKTSLDEKALADFLDYLRYAGYQIGTRQYVLASDLLAVFLAQRGKADTELFLTALRPVLAKSPQEQETFRATFERWSAIARERRNEAPAKTDRETDRASRLERELRSVSKGTWIVVSVLLVLGVAGPIVYRLLRPPPPVLHDSPIVSTPAQTQAPRAPVERKPLDEQVQSEVKAHERSLATLIWEGSIFLSVSAGVWMFWWRFRTRRFLNRHTTNTTPDLTAIHVGADSGHLLPGGTARSLGLAFRRRVPVTSSEIAVSATVEKTAASGGEFTPVYGIRQVMPEYVFMVDSRGRVDEVGRFADELRRYIDQGDRLIKVFYFIEDPAILFPQAQGGRPVLLDEIAGGCQDGRLVVFADAASVTQGTVERTQARVAQFNGWSERFWITPGPVEGRRPQERLLLDSFHVFASSTSGMEELARSLGTTRRQTGGTAESALAEPLQLQIRPDRWMRRTPAEEDEVYDLIISLRTYLGPAGFDWLCACAVYPEIHPLLTRYIGRNLKQADGTALLESGLYLNLSRLLWFREGRMPQWMRARLIGELSPRRMEEVHALLGGMLLSSLRGDISGLELKIAGQHPAAVSRLLRGMLPQLARTASEDNPLSDVVFISFLAKETGVPLPQAVLNLIRTGVADGRVRNLELTPKWTRRSGRLILALIGVCFGLEAIGAVGYALGSTNEIFVSFMWATAIASFLGAPLLWWAWRTLRLTVLVTAIAALLNPAVAIALAFVEVRPLLGVLAVLLGVGSTLLVVAALRSCRYLLPISKARLRPWWLKIGIVGTGMAFAGELAVLTAALADATDPALYFGLGVATLQVLAGPILAFTSMETRIRPGFIAAALLLCCYISAVLDLVALYLTDKTPFGNWMGEGIAGLYGAAGLYLCFRAWQRAQAAKERPLKAVSE